MSQRILTFWPICKRRIFPSLPSSFPRNGFLFRLCFVLNLTARKGSLYTLKCFGSNRLRIPLEQLLGLFKIINKINTNRAIYLTRNKITQFSIQWCNVNWTDLVVLGEGVDGVGINGRDDRHGGGDRRRRSGVGLGILRSRRRVGLLEVKR